MNDMSQQEQAAIATTTTTTTTHNLNRNAETITTESATTVKVITASEEEQRVSSTSSPASQPIIAVVQQLQQNTSQSSSPAHITSTTASPPQRMRDDETQSQQETIANAPLEIQQAVIQPMAATSAEASRTAMAATMADPGGGGGVAASGSVGDAISSCGVGGGGFSGSGDSGSNSIINVSGIQQEQELRQQSNENKHKIIIKLSKPSCSKSSNSSSGSSSCHESHMNLEAAPSPSCTTASNNNINDFRRVEPLIIHLPTSSSASTNAAVATYSSCSSKHMTTKQSDAAAAAAVSDASSCSCSSSCADDDLNTCNSSSAGIPHIVPKLTIRAANEQRGTTHTTIVPKLIIKMPDNNTALANMHNKDMLLTTNKNVPGINANASVETAATAPPPLPKLTIKTVDGTSESIISSLSPASATSSSSSSCASSASCSPMVSNIVASAIGHTNIDMESMAQVVPKLTIKQLPKKNLSNEVYSAGAGTVPKLSIKTLHMNANCNSNGEDNLMNPANSAADTTLSNKIPKMTIKTGQEHTVIMTHDASNSHSIPKLTIKTKSIEIEDANATHNEHQQQHLQNSSNNMPPTIPKLTISVGGATSEAVRGPQSPATALVVRQTAANSPDRVPKLTISRQQQQLQDLNHKILNSLDANENESVSTPTTTTAKLFGVRSNSLQSENIHCNEKIPKLTIKTISDELPITANEKHLLPHVPKLTIKNLSSPKHKVRAILEDKSATAVQLIASITGTEKKFSQCKQQQQPEKSIVVNGGESSSSQDFCGFSDDAMVVITESENNIGNATKEERRNSDDMDIDDALQREHDPQMFHNFSISPNNGTNAAISAKNLQNKTALVIDTVDLTSSPSPGSSPAYINHNFNEVNTSAGASKQLLNCLHLPTTVATVAATAAATIHNSTAPARTNILLSQLTAPQKTFNPSKLSTSTLPLANASKYPELTERLMSNGGSVLNENIDSSSPNLLAAAASAVKTTQHRQDNQQNIIDSIEILDTPEGSPNPEQLAHDISKSLKNVIKHHNNHYEAGVCTLDTMHLNNNIMIESNMLNINKLKRHTDVNKDENMFDPNKMDMPAIKQRRLDHIAISQESSALQGKEQQDNKVTNATDVITVEQKKQATATNISGGSTTSTHRSRKQKHDHILNAEADALFTSNSTRLMNFYLEDRGNNSNTTTPLSNITLKETAVPPTVKRRGRPKRITVAAASTVTEPIGKKSEATTGMELSTSDATTMAAVKSRRVQLLRKRLAIDMVSAEQPPTDVNLDASIANAAEDALATVNTPRRDHRQLRATRRAAMPNVKTPITAAATTITPMSLTKSTRKRHHNLKSHLETTVATVAATTADMDDNAAAGPMVANHFTAANQVASSDFVPSSSSQIDLTMCSSSSSASASNGSGLLATMTTTLAVTDLVVHTVASVASGCSGSGNNTSSSMLPPTTILSSSDPVPDVIFQPNDFSSIIATQQLRASRTSSISGGSQVDSFDDNGSSAPEKSGDDLLGSAINFSAVTPISSGRGRGRGRGSRGSRGGSSGARGASGARAPRLSRGASAVAKAIAMSRPRCVGGLKHTPDPERLKGLFSPSPQVFEEDTRMSADLNGNQSMSMEPPVTPQRQPQQQTDFLNNEESQSSIVSSNSALDSQFSAGCAVKRPKKKKMEICVAEDTEFSVSTIAEYDWPPPKGCCPSKNRDTFMIQEQVALYLGIKSFKRKYPDLPRRAIDMEERNWLQEKGLVSEKMCDLGITAVWASDILDIMYADFFDKYEEYKEFIRQKHLREIELKQKALGLNIGNGRGLQARDRAMLSASKWNAYFNKIRKEERQACLDLQTFTSNIPLPQNAPISTFVNRPIVEAALSAADAENLLKPPTLLRQWDSKDRNYVTEKDLDAAYPLSLVPGQYMGHYRHYTPLELRCYPLNTVLDDPLTLPERLQLQDAQKKRKEHSVTGYVKSMNTKQCSPTRRKRRTLQEDSAEAEKEELSAQSELETNIHKLKFSTGANSIDTSTTESDSDSSNSGTDSDSASSVSSISGTALTDSGDEDDDEEDTSSAICGVCLRSQRCNTRNLPELFIQCYTCRRHVHPSCIEMTTRMVNRCRNYNWQCADCKCCIKCKRKQEPHKMLYCEQCDRGYHVYCLGVKTVPDGRWSCERCSFCLRCGATKPEGLPYHQQQQMQISPNGEKIKPVKHKKVKWINEYRIDHITKLREHCSMLCVPCARIKPTKRAQTTANPIATGSSYNNNSSSNNNNSSSLSSSMLTAAKVATTESNVATAEASAAATMKTQQSIATLDNAVTESCSEKILTETLTNSNVNNHSNSINDNSSGSIESHDLETVTAKTIVSLSNTTAAAAAITTTTADVTASATATNATTATAGISIAPPPVVA